MKSGVNQKCLSGPPSPRPSPTGEGESFAVSFENLRLDWRDDLPQNPRARQGYSLSPGERVRVRASVEQLFFGLSST